MGDFHDSLRKCQKSRTGHLVELSDVPVLSQRSRRYVRDVVCVDERFRHLPDRECDLAAKHPVGQKVLAEVDQLEGGDAQVADGTVWRRATVGKRAMGGGLDGSERLGTEGREAIG